MAVRDNKEATVDKILRIDMGAKGGPKISKEPLGPYSGMGGRGMTSAIVSKEVPPLCHPLGAENKLVIAPGLLSAHYQLGVALDARGDRDAAIEQYRLALRIAPEHRGAERFSRSGRWRRCPHGLARGSAPRSARRPRGSPAGKRRR